MPARNGIGCFGNAIGVTAEIQICFCKAGKGLCLKQGIVIGRRRIERNAICGARFGKVAGPVKRFTGFEIVIRQRPGCAERTADKGRAPRTNDFSRQGQTCSVCQAHEKPRRNCRGLSQ